MSHPVGRSCAVRIAGCLFGAAIAAPAVAQVYAGQSAGGTVVLSDFRSAEAPSVLIDAPRDDARAIAPTPAPAADIRTIVREIAASEQVSAQLLEAVIAVDSDGSIERDRHRLAEGKTAMQYLPNRLSIGRELALIGVVSGASHDQSGGLGQINQALIQLDQVTQSNAALVEQSAAATASLREQAANLAEAVRVFRLEDAAVAA